MPPKKTDPVPPAVENEQPEVVTPDPARHVFLDANMFDIADIGLDSPRERRIDYGGNWEHVGEHESGCWLYRRM